MLYPLLLALVLLVSLHDLYHARVPNWVTLPLLGIGLLWNFPSFLRAGPGTLETWLACLLLFAAWRAGWIGGGDAKLWMALLWLAPAAQAQAVTTNVSTGLNTSASPALVMSGAFVLTALAQLLWRLWHSCYKFRPAPRLSVNTANAKTPLTGVKSPGAWRTIPYAIWLCTIPISGWLF